MSAKGADVSELLLYPDHELKQELVIVPELLYDPEPMLVPPRTSSEDPLATPVKKRPASFSVDKQEIIVNIYKHVKNTWPEHAYPSNEKMIEKTSEISGVSKRTIYRILAAYRATNALGKGTMKKKKKSIINKLDCCEKSAIRTKVHRFFLEGEMPTLNKILQSVNDDDQLPNLSRSNLRRVLLHLKFKYIKRRGKSILIDRPDIVLRRTKYLRDIQRFRNEGKHIFYVGETWVNAGHTVEQVWEDTTTQSALQVAKNTIGKGNKFIAVHIGSEGGILEDMEWVFPSSKADGHHESMDTPHFEKWFGKVLQKLRTGDVIVMDNARYHCRRLEKTPTMFWRRRNIQEWLDSKQIEYEPSDTKACLMQKVKPIKTAYAKFVIDEMAKEKGITVLRLPPHHCGLNPIELVWADVKSNVARNNTFQFTEVKNLLTNGLARITADKWKNCVQHVLNEEEIMRGIDNIIDNIADKFLLNVTDNFDSECSTDSEELSDYDE